MKTTYYQSIFLEVCQLGSFALYYLYYILTYNYMGSPEHTNSRFDKSSSADISISRETQDKLAWECLRLAMDSSNKVREVFRTNLDKDTWAAVFKTVFACSAEVEEMIFARLCELLKIGNSSQEAALNELGKP